MGKFIENLIAAVLSLFIGALLIMLTWNYVMPDLFNLQTITYWQSVMLHILAGSLFNTARVEVTNFKE